MPLFDRNSQTVGMLTEHIRGLSGEERPMTTEKKYSAEWVRGQAAAIDAQWLDHHRCGLCNKMVGYPIRGDEVRFRSACHCSWSPDRPSSFQDIADWLAMQSSDEIRDRIMEGLQPRPATATVAAEGAPHAPD
jgi:hypothetical protein